MRFDVIAKSKNSSIKARMFRGYENVLTVLKTHFLGKNNVTVIQNNQDGSLPGYLSLHQVRAFYKKILRIFIVEKKRFIIPILPLQDIR